MLVFMERKWSVLFGLGKRKRNDVRKRAVGIVGSAGLRKKLGSGMWLFSWGGVGE